MHDHVWVLLPDAILKFLMPCVRTDVSGRLRNEFVLFKQPIAYERRVFLQITLMQMIELSMETGDIENIFCTPFIKCVASALLYPNVFTTQEAHHALLREDYVE